MHNAFVYVSLIGLRFSWYAAQCNVDRSPRDVMVGKIRRWPNLHMFHFGVFLNRLPAGFHQLGRKYHISRIRAMEKTKYLGGLVIDTRIQP